MSAIEQTRNPSRDSWWHSGVVAVSVLLLGSILPAVLGIQSTSRLVAEDALTEAAGDPAKQAVMSGLYAVLVALALVTIVRNPRRVSLLLVALVLWTAASVMWSSAPDVTLRRTIGLVGTLLLGIFAGTTMEPREFARTLAMVSFGAIVASIAYALLWRDLGLDFDDKLRGLFSDKNTFGAFCCVSLMAEFALYWLDAEGRNGLLSSCRGAIILAALVWAGSSTSIAIAVGLLCTHAALVVFGAKALSPLVIATPIFAVGAGGAIVGYEGFRQTIAGLLNRDPTWSYRAPIWSFVLDRLSLKPWTGYGYDGFWIGSQSPGSVFWFEYGAAALHSHNGLLNLAAGLGIIGCLLLLVLVVAFIWRTVAFATTDERIWAVFFCVVFFVENLTESKMWQANEIFTYLFAYSITIGSLRRVAAAQT